VGNCPGLGSVWVSGQVQFPGYIVNNNPRSTFDLAVPLAGNLIDHGGDDNLRNVWLACGRSSVSYATIPGQKTMPHEKKSNLWVFRAKKSKIHSL